MIEVKSTATVTMPRFEEGQPVTGWRWGGTDWVKGAYVHDFGTGGKALLVELEDGSRVPIVAETAQPADQGAEQGGRHRRRDDEPTETFGVVPEDLLPLPGDDEPTQVFEVVEETAIESVSGTLPEMPVVEAEPATGTRVTAFFALVWFRIVAFFAVVVAEVADTIWWSAQWEEKHAYTIAKVVVATLSMLVLAGAGVGWWLA